MRHSDWFERASIWPHRHQISNGEFLDGPRRCGEESSIRHDDEMPGPAPRVDLAQSTALKRFDPRAVERGWSRLPTRSGRWQLSANAKYDRDEFSVVPVEIGITKPWATTRYFVRERDKALREKNSSSICSHMVHSPAPHAVDNATSPRRPRRTPPASVCRGPTSRPFGAERMIQTEDDEQQQTKQDGHRAREDRVAAIALEPHEAHQADEHEAAKDQAESQ